ncbi:hypothetical protein PV396_37930 [Streptomyces sp. ME02-8801-2C]|nr:hypothetical protein [Streptomyces sp. ME02-8801-2C]MDX3457668.1 hypothetical protein [Streptomyces sp. ME02-8801-2C]
MTDVTSDTEAGQVGSGRLEGGLLQQLTKRVLEIRTGGRAH